MHSAEDEGVAAHRLRVEVAGELCMGTRLCNAIAPEVLAYDSAAGVTRARRSPVAGNEAVLEAAEKCPVGAILLWDDDTAERVEP